MDLAVARGIGIGIGTGGADAMATLQSCAAATSRWVWVDQILAQPTHDMHGHAMSRARSRSGTAPLRAPPGLQHGS